MRDMVNVEIGDDPPLSCAVQTEAYAIATQGWKTAADDYASLGKRHRRWEIVKG